MNDDLLGVLLAIRETIRQSHELTEQSRALRDELHEARYLLREGLTRMTATVQSVPGSNGFVNGNGHVNGYKQKRPRMSKSIIVKVQTPIATNAPVEMALVYDQTREVHFTIPKGELVEWDEVVKNGGKAFYLARLAGGKISLVRRVSDRAW